MICGACNNQGARHIQIKFDKDNNRIEICDKCGSVGNALNPDVYWPGGAYKSDNITDRMGIPIELRSKRHKAEVMKSMGIIESGDTHRGSRGGL